MCDPNEKVRRGLKKKSNRGIGVYSEYLPKQYFCGPVCDHLRTTRYQGCTFLLPISRTCTPDSSAAHRHLCCALLLQSYERDPCHFRVVSPPSRKSAARYSYYCCPLDGPFGSVPSLLRITDTRPLLSADAVTHSGTALSQGLFTTSPAAQELRSISSIHELPLCTISASLSAAARVAV